MVPAEVDYGCNLTAEVDCPETFFAETVEKLSTIAHDLLVKYKAKKELRQKQRE
jgi:hypothetical protein